MGQKINPHGFRVGVIKSWDTRWYADKKEFSKLLGEDYKIRKTLKTMLKDASVSKIEIERAAARVVINIYTSRPGIVIGKGGEGVNKIRETVAKMTGRQVAINVVEIRNADLDAQLVAENIAAQVERRISFRRAMKQAVGRTMKAGAKGIKTKMSGRLGGAEIARSEGYHEGSIPLQTLRADIEYGFAEAKTTYGRIGVKVWIYKGQVLPGQKRAEVPEAPARRPRRANAEGGK